MASNVVNMLGVMLANWQDGGECEAFSCMQSGYLIPRDLCVIMMAQPAYSIKGESDLLSLFFLI